MQFLWRLEEVIRSSGTGVTRDSCETPCGYSVRVVHCSHWLVNWNTAVSQWQVLFPVYDLIFQNTDNLKCTQNSVCIHFIQSKSETMHIFTKGSMVFPEVCYLFFLSIGLVIVLAILVPLYLQRWGWRCVPLELSCLAIFWVLEARQLKSSWWLGSMAETWTREPKLGMRWT